MSTPTRAMATAAASTARPKGTPCSAATKATKAPHTNTPPSPKWGTRRMLKMIVRLMAINASTAPFTRPLARTCSTRAAGRYWP